MKNIIIDLIHEILTEERIYNTLFGCDEILEHNKININWIINKCELTESVKIILEHALSLVLQSYNSNKYEPAPSKLSSQYKEIVFEDNAIVNRFLPINYEITNPDIKFADLENYLEDIVVTDNGPHIYFKWSFPIYHVSKSTLNTY